MKDKWANVILFFKQSRLNNNINNATSFFLITAEILVVEY